MKRRAISVPLILFLLCVLTVSSSLPVFAEDTGSITGRVTDTATGQPISSASISAMDFSSGDFCGYALSDSDGQYSITGLSTGDYRVTVLASGYANEYYQETYSYSEATPVSVTAPMATESINFSMDTTGYISGKIIDNSTGNPITGCTVIAASIIANSGIIALTDEHGHYTITGVPSGQYRVSAQANGYVTTYYQNTTSYMEAMPVTVTAPHETTNIDIALGQGGVISGIVLDRASSQPIPGINIIIFDQGTFQWVGSASTDAAGHYSMTVPEGVYLVSSRSTPLSPVYAKQFYDDVHSMTEATPVTAAPGSVQTVNFNLDPGGTISGTVVDEATLLPIANVRVSASIWETDQWMETGITDESGSYSIIVPSGVYRIKADTMIHGLSYIDEYYDDASLFEDAAPVVVTAPGANPDINFSLTSTEDFGSVSGTVTDDMGQPVPNAFVNALEYTDGTMHGYSLCDENGDYTISGLQAGNYRIAAVATGYATMYYQDTFSYMGATPVPVADSSSIENIDFTLVPAGSITGRVTDLSTGEPIAGASVFAAYDQTEQGFMGTSDENGFYLVNGLPSGQYRLFATADSYATIFYKNALYVGESTLVTVTSPGNTNAIDVALVKSYETLTGEDIAVTDAATGITIGFEVVNVAGSTYVFPTAEPQVPSIELDFLGQYYNITTNAAYTGGIEVTIPYDDSGLTQGEEEALRLYQWNGDSWEDVTGLPNDTANNYISGIVPSLSWFAVGTPLPQVTWLPPISNEEPFSAHAGRNIPVKFRLTDAAGQLLTEESVELIVTRTADGTTVFSGAAARAQGMNGYHINVKTRGWEPGEYILRLSANPNETYTIVLVEKGQG